MPSSEKSISSLEAMGVKVYGLDEPHVNSTENEISWDNIAGYDQQKRYVLLSVTYFCSSLVKYVSYIRVGIDKRGNNGKRPMIKR